MKSGERTDKANGHIQDRPKILTGSNVSPPTHPNTNNLRLQCEREYSTSTSTTVLSADVPPFLVYTRIHIPLRLPLRYEYSYEYDYPDYKDYEYCTGTVLTYRKITLFISTRRRRAPRVMPDRTVPVRVI